MTTEKIDEIRARCDAATPGPWSTTVAEVCVKLNYADILVCEMYEQSLEQQKNNARFIAHAREDIPALLDEIERLTVQGDFDYAEAMSLVLSHEGRIEKLQCELDKALSSHSCPYVNQKNEIDRLTRERDAAVADIKKGAYCITCSKENERTLISCYDCGSDYSSWQWRGLEASTS